jgi:ABC-type branched-subunit amino acid transport system ATPase component
LCKVVSGLLAPSGGVITLDSRDITSQRAHQRAKSLLLPPESLGILPSLPVEDHGPVIVKPAKLLIADEPTLGLAPLIVEEIMAVFAQLRNAGVTLLVVEERAPPP